MINIDFRIKINAYLKLIRPANVITAAADVVAGFSAARAFQLFYDQNTSINQSLEQLPWLVLSTMMLYAGGVVLNDAFDARLDTQERPERPIPSGQVGQIEAAVLGTLFLVLGIATARFVSPTATQVALAIALLATAYNVGVKRHVFLGPLTMGGCRALNLILGVSAFPSAIPTLWFISAFHLLYIVAITAVSRGEVHGGSQKSGIAGFSIQAMVFAGFVALALLPTFNFWLALPFLVLLGWRVLPPFFRVVRNPSPLICATAVQAGVLSLIFLDAAISAGFLGPLWGLIILALFPLSRYVARFFAVT